jgi:hypothetical protein
MQSDFSNFMIFFLRKWLAAPARRPAYSLGRPGPRVAFS